MNDVRIEKRLAALDDCVDLTVSGLMIADYPQQHLDTALAILKGAYDHLVKQVRDVQPS